MSEYCLSSLIRHALDWRQLKIAEAEKSDHQRKKVEGRLSALKFVRNFIFQKHRTPTHEYYRENFK